ncbi:IS4 family transposase [Salmonella enterica]|nr:IS4 family transposase [Salmonella enterica]
MFQQDIEFVAEALDSELSVFRREINPLWIEEALQSTHSASIRRRRIPAEQAVWLVLMMGLLRDMSIKSICSTLSIAIQTSTDFEPVAPSVLTDCRKRLGDSPVETLFNITAGHWRHQTLSVPEFCGLHLLCVDGSVFRTPDSDENREAFGFINNTRTAFPQIRMVALMSAWSHMLLAATHSTCKRSEVTLAQELIASIPEHSLTLFDKGCFSAAFLHQWGSKGTACHWLIPLKKNTKYQVTHKYSEQDMLIKMGTSPGARQQCPDIGKFWTARLIRLVTPDGKEKNFLTSLVSDKDYPYEKISEIYNERWEIERGFGELKSQQLKNEVTLRSRFPEGVRQEIWGILIACNLIRKEMSFIAEEANVLPVRISFIAALNLIESQVRYCELSPTGTLPERLKRMRKNIMLYILPSIRKHRHYDRTVLYIPDKYSKRYKNA